MNEGTDPVVAASRLLGDKWTFIVLRNLSGGARRFKDLEHAGWGISPSMLSARLKSLEEHGMVTRTCFNEIPPRVEYDLTAKGRDALPVVEALATFARRWLSDSGACATSEALSGSAGSAAR